MASVVFPTTIQDHYGDPIPEVATILDFIEAINRGDLDAMDALIAERHTMWMFNEAPDIGRAVVLDAWRDYLFAFPEFKIQVHSYAVNRGVAVLGHRTGSHLPTLDTNRLPTVIWFGQVESRRITLWRVLTDTPEHRRELGVSF
jgi:limonene-1,2-epoxide hydrolase